MEVNVTEFKSGLRYGSIMGIALSVLTLVMYYTGIDTGDIENMKGGIVSSIFDYIICTVCIVLAIRYYKQNNEQLFLGQSIMTALYTAAIAAVIYFLFQLLFFYVIAPEILDNIRGVIENENVIDDDVPEEARQTVTWMVGVFTSPVVIGAMSLVGNLFYGFVVGLIGGLIMKTQ